LTTSQLFLQASKLANQLQVSADVGLLDIHVTAPIFAIDMLLTAGCSHAPAVSAVVKDVRLFKLLLQRERSDVDHDVLKSLRERAEATLSNLVTVSKTGISPVWMQLLPTYQRPLRRLEKLSTYECSSFEWLLAFLALCRGD
jgi:protein SPA2